MNWDVSNSTKVHCFNVQGHEWPTLLMEIADWLVETNNCVSNIAFHDGIEEEYLEASVMYSGKYTTTFENPLAVTPEEILEQYHIAICGDVDK